MPRWDEQVTMPSDLSPVAEGEVVTYHLPLDEVHRRYGKPGERRSIVRTESDKVLQLLESGKTPAQVREETGYSLQQIGGIVTSRGRKYSDLPFWPRLVESIRADKESTNALVQEFGVSWPTMQKLIAAEGEKRAEQAKAGAVNGGENEDHSERPAGVAEAVEVARAAQQTSHGEPVDTNQHRPSVDDRREALDRLEAALMLGNLVSQCRAGERTGVTLDQGAIDAYKRLAAHTARQARATLLQ